VLYKLVCQHNGIILWRHQAHQLTVHLRVQPQRDRQLSQNTQKYK
jgi:hypothetical protein